MSNRTLGLCSRQGGRHYRSGHAQLQKKHGSYEGCTSCRSHLFQNSNLHSATTMLTCLHRLCCSSTRFRLEIETKVEQVQSWSAFCGLWPCVGCALHSSRHPDGVCALCNVLPAFLHHWTPASSHMTAEGIVSEVKTFKALPRKVDKAFLMNPEAQFVEQGSQSNRYLQQYNCCAQPTQSDTASKKQLHVCRSPIQTQRMHLNTKILGRTCRQLTIIITDFRTQHVQVHVFAKWIENYTSCMTTKTGATHPSAGTLRCGGSSS